MGVCMGVRLDVGICVCGWELGGCVYGSRAEKKRVRVDQCMAAAVLSQVGGGFFS